MAHEAIGEAIAAVRDATASLQKALALYNSGKADLQSAPLDVLLRGYVALSVAHDQAETARKELNVELEFLSRSKVPERLELAKTKNTTVTVGNRDYRVGVGYRYSASMLNKPKAIAYLKAGDENMRALVKEEVNAKTLSSFAKDYVQNQGKELPDDLFKVGNVAYTSVTAK